MKIDRQTIEKVSKLARLELTEPEKDEFSKQLSDIITYVEKINELNTADVKTADHVVDLGNVFRQDKVLTSIDKSEVEKIAPDFENGHFIVPRILEG
jgi:aspartyl-tRNA(Asn)/glutamyl-tRNA(Gln) amidotransferase subunit C